MGKENREAAQENVQTLEQKFVEIEQIIEKMEMPEVSLEESFALYQQGIAQIKSCSQMLDMVEKKMQTLCDDGSTEDFITS